MRRSRPKLRRLFREFDEDADPRRPTAKRPLAEASARAAARELVPLDGTVCLMLLIAHLRLNDPERVTIAYLAALISEPTRCHGLALYLMRAWLICILAPAGVQLLSEEG